MLPFHGTEIKVNGSPTICRRPLERLNIMQKWLYEFINPVIYVRKVESEL